MPSLAILAQLQRGGGGQAYRPGTLSPADKQNLTARQELGDRADNETRTALQIASDNAQAFKDQTAPLPLDTQLAAHDAKKQTDEDAALFGRIRSDHQEATARIQSQLADLQAQGID